MFRLIVSWEVVEFNSKYPDSVPADVPPVTPAHYWTNTRRSIHAWLNEQAPPLAELYEGAVQLIFEKPIPGKLRFVAHAVREIRNRLPGYISGGKSGERLEYKNELDRLLKIWQDSSLSLNSSLTDTGIGDEASLPLSREISIPLHLFHSIQQLFIKHIAVTTNNKEKAIQFFETSIPQNQPLRNTLRPIAEHWWDVTEWFMEKTHDSGRVTPGDDEQKLHQQFELFESFLGTLAQSFYTTTDALDEILKEANAKQIDKAVPLLIHPQQRYYFFNRLENPQWIVPLREKGFFKNPPHVVHNSSEGTVGYPTWAESAYLARMAAQEPSAVLEIVLQIETDNPRVHEDFVKAALQMPPALAVKIVPKVKTWVKSKYLSYTFSEEVAALAVHLAKGGEVKKALELAGSVLAVEQDPRMNSGEASENRIYRFSPKPQARLNNWDYEQILKKYVPELVTVGGEDALKMLGSILCCAVKFSHSWEENKEQDENLPIKEDRSIYWRPAIEDHPRNHPPNEVRELLVVAVRDAAEQIIAKDPAKMRSLVLRLEKWRWRIFHRIALYLLRKFPGADRNLLLERLTDRKHFSNTSRYEDYEYVYLIKECFADLPKEQQEKILSWIENPDIDWSWLEDREEKARRVKYWQLSKLTPLKDNLPAKWQQRYEQLVDEFGSVELSNIVFGGVGKVSISASLKSPKTDSELECMSIEELTSFLRTWQPDPGARFDEPSWEGLGDALARLAEKSPERYALAAEHFQGLHAIYIRNLLRGLHKALNNQKEQQGELREFSWSSVLSLCRRIVEESEQIQERQTTDSDHDLYWREAYRRVADLLGVGLTADQSGIPFNLREEVWNALRPLTQHPDPTPEYETRYGGSNMNPSELSINTVRGEAMHTVMQYALWIRRHFEQTADGAKHWERGFDEMPEVRQVLDTHLAPEQEPSLAIRSVYGQWFPWLVLLDQHWVAQNIERIFPQDEALSDLRRVAWESYVTYCSVYENVFDVLHQEYTYAVERLDAASSEERLTDAHQNFAQHLMTLYGRGKLGLDEPGGLLKRFFELAPDALRGYTLEFVGHSLRETEDGVDSQILNQLQLLWEQRLEAAHTATPPTSHATELAAFGWWFASGKFNDSWAIAQLKQVFELVDKVDADFLVVKRLAELADAMPELVIECLKLMIEKDKSGYSWRDDDIKTILAAGIKSSNDKAKQSAEALINYLGERGCWKFRELLSKASK